MHRFNAFAKPVRAFNPAYMSLRGAPPLWWRRAHGWPRS